MEWEPKKFHMAFTKYLLFRLEMIEINEKQFCESLELPGRTIRDAKWGRKKDGNYRNWTGDDLCKISNYFKETPYHIIHEVERFYHDHIDTLLDSIPEKKTKKKYKKRSKS